MSLQDDYFDLQHHLKGEYKKKFLRIWEYMCDLETNHDKLQEIVSSFKRAIRLASEDEQRVDVKYIESLAKTKKKAIK